MAGLCSSLMSCFLVTLLKYLPIDFEMVPVAPLITGIAFVTSQKIICFIVRIVKPLVHGTGSLGS
jgi:hypothetical protein